MTYKVSKISGGAAVDVLHVHRACRLGRNGFWAGAGRGEFLLRVENIGQNACYL